METWLAHRTQPANIHPMSRQRHRSRGGRAPTGNGDQDQRLATHRSRTACNIFTFLTSPNPSGSKRQCFYQQVHTPNDHNAGGWSRWSQEHRTPGLVIFSLLNYFPFLWITNLPNLGSLHTSHSYAARLLPPGNEFTLPYKSTHYASTWFIYKHMYTCIYSNLTIIISLKGRWVLRIQQ